MVDNTILMDLMDAYLTECEIRKLAPKTIEGYKKLLRAMLLWLSDNEQVERLSDLTPMHYKRYLLHKEKDGASPQYINDILRVMRTFSRFLYDEGYTPKLLTEKIKNVKQPKVKIVSFTEEEIQGMLNYYKGNSFLEVRNRAMIAMFFDTGIRCDELISMQPEQVQSGFIIINGKGSKQRVVPLSPILAKALLKYDQTKKRYFRKKLPASNLFLSKNGRRLSNEAIRLVLIQSKEHTDHWQFVEVYTDKGITGTSTSKREGFNRMIKDALAGKIDLIITKSVSRFARNTVDTLTTIRKLKEHGVEVYFEEQNIYTLDGKGEVLLTIMSSIAQEESRNISENVTWGMRKRFADGKVSMPYKQFMGYRRSKTGTPEIVEEEAQIIRTIFRRFLEGATPAIIARELNAADIPCPSRKSLLGENENEAEKARKQTARWSPSTVESILTNEKYKGDAILQKTYCTDYIKKTFVVNDGSEIPKYYAQNSHPAIVSAEVYDLTQMELEWRRSLKGSYSGKSCFSSRIICGDCGAFYWRKVWHSTDEYRRTIWRCNNKYEGENKCSTPHVTRMSWK